MYEENPERIKKEELKRLLGQIENARVGLVGDLCLDLYWLADMKLSELSRETPNYPLPVVEERYSPGGAGNVACNMAALKPEKVLALGVIGTDWRGDLLLESLKKNEIRCDYLIQDDGRVTNTYIKPLRRGISDVVYEDARIDFEAREPVSEETENKILQALEHMEKEVDVICVSDQMKFGCITPKVREYLCELGKQGKTIVVDSRDHADAYRWVTVKPNEVESARSFGKGTETEMEELSQLALSIFRKNERTTLMTLGERGCFVVDEDKAVHCEACKVEGSIDFCGAGDTFMAGYGTLLAAVASPLQAAQIANLCSAVTIKKIGTTGTASREEVVKMWEKLSGTR